jgi:hypothetical protein
MNFVRKLGSRRGHVVDLCNIEKCRNQAQHTLRTSSDEIGFCDLHWGLLFDAVLSRSEQLAQRYRQRPLTAMQLLNLQKTAPSSTNAQASQQ